MEKRIMSLSRHDMVKVSFEGRCRIFFEILKENNDIPRDILADTLLSPTNLIPGVVRRGDKCDGKLNVGFVSHMRGDNGKVKIAGVANDFEIESVIEPYIIPFLKFDARNKCLNAAKKIMELSETANGNIGIVGSAAMEIITGNPYTNDNSDLDIVIRRLSRSMIASVFTALMQIGQEMDLSIDAEIQLDNGYGIKAKELFVGSYTLLGKGLYDVVLLERSDVVSLLD